MTRIAHWSTSVLSLAALAALPFLSGCTETKSGDEFQAYEAAEEPAATAPGKAATQAPPEIAKQPEATAPGEPAPMQTAAEPAEATTPAEAENVEVAQATPAEPVAAAPAVVDPALEPQPANPLENAVADAPRVPAVLIPEHEAFKVEGPEEAIRVSYDDLDLLKVLNLEPVTPEGIAMMPDWLKQLNGRRIRIRGFMYPPYESTGISNFILARDNEICCFGRNPKVYDVFPVSMREGETTDYIQNRPFDVIGVFHIAPEGGVEDLYQVYFIDDAVIIK